MASGYSVWCEFDQRCNLKCSFCYNHWREEGRRAPPIPDTTSVLDVLRQLFQRVEVTQLVLSGGEVTLRRDFNALLSFIAQYQVPVVLTTNGTTLTSERIAYCMRMGVQTFQIPLLAANQPLHDSIAGVPSWERALESFVLLGDAGAEVALVFVATELNLHEFPDVVEIAAVLGVRKIIFNTFVGSSGAGKRNRAELEIHSRSRLIDTLSAANEIALNADVDIQLGTPLALTVNEKTMLTRVSGGPCPVGCDQRRFVLDGRGDIRSCPQSRRVLGNIRHDHPVDALKGVGPPTASGQYKCHCLEEGDRIPKPGPSCTYPNLVPVP